MKTATPRISVLMPVYNAEAFVAQAIDSILQQTFRDFEFLILDDGSTDGSAEIIRQFAQRDSRIKVFSGPNRGLLAVLKQGTDLARGDFIARMDADDISDVDRFERQLNFLNANTECVAVGTRVLRVDLDGDPLSLAPVSCDHDCIDNELLHNRSGKICHPTVMMRTQAVRDVGGYQQEYHLEDVDLFLRLAEVGKLANLDEPLLRYRLHGSSICHTRKRDQINQIYAEIVERARHRRGESPCSTTAGIPKSEIGQSEAPSVLKQSLENACCWSSLAIEGGYRRTAWKHAIRAIRIQSTAGKSWWALSCCLLGRSMTDQVFSLLSKTKRYAFGRRSKKQKLPESQQGPCI